jgi:integrase
VVDVRQQLVDLGGRVSFEPPKTTSGARRLELDSHTVGVLLDQRLRQDTQRDRWGDAHADHGLVFCREDGTPLAPDAVTKRFGAPCEAAGVRRVRLHDLRNGAASLRLAAGVELAIVSKILGHSSIAITNDTYAHLLDGVGRDAAERAAALVPRAPVGSRGTAGLPSGSRSSTAGVVEPSGSVNAQVSEGGPRGTRTHNPRIKSPLLCQLS